MKLSILFILFIFGCTGFESVKDCGIDKNCFMEAEKTCTSAKVRFSGQFGPDSVSEQFVNGSKGDSCIISIKIIESQNILKNKEMSCTVPKSLLADLDQADLKLSNQQMFDFCSGSLIALLKELGVR